MVDVRKIRLILELREYGISNSDVLSAIETIPREFFLSDAFKSQSYENIALPIAEGQTISQPLIVALMTDALQINKTHKILEIGTGSGYQTTILSILARRIYTIERIKSLLINAEIIFKKLKLNNIVTKHADGNLGWQEQIPFDRILFTAATKNISKTIFNHLKEEGIMVAPMINKSKQILTKFIKKGNELKSESISDVLFVPNLKGVKD